MEANAALRTIVGRDNGESYRAMLTRMAQESGVETPTAEDLVRFDRKRKGKTLSNADWKSPIDPDARATRMKDETTHLAYKAEHSVDLDSGVVVAALDPSGRRRRYGDALADPRSRGAQSRRSPATSAAELSEAGKCLGNGTAAVFKRRSERDLQHVSTIGFLN
jgi:hypothetical protein